MKFDENFFRSFSLIALSWLTRLRRSSASRFFSNIAKFRNESSTSVSTLVVALGVDALEISAGRAVLAAAVLLAEVSLTASFLTSCGFVSPEAAAAAAPMSAGFASVLFCS